MFSKILLALGVVLAISALGSAVKCNICVYSTALPKSLQKCPDTTINCPTEYCFTSTYTYENGTEIVARSCGSGGVCPDTGRWCKILTSLPKVKSCDSKCCKTDNCNNYTPNKGGSPKGNTPKGTPDPNSATGAMTTKLIPCLMVIAAFLFA